MTNPRFRLRTFGGLFLDSIERQGEPLVARRKCLALLALLGVAGDTGMSRDSLIGFLWPDGAEDQGRNSLSQLLYGLRRDLQSDAVLGSTELRLNAAVIEADVLSFKRAIDAGEPAAAVTSYRGPFLDGFYVRGLRDFERWTFDQRSRLSLLNAQALESLARTAESREEWGTAAGWWHQLAVLDPLSARIAQGHARALTVAGDRSAAVRSLAAHAAAVRAELGVEPEPVVTELTIALRNGDAEGSVSAPAAASLVAGAGHSPADADLGTVPAPASVPGVAKSFPSRTSRRLWSLVAGSAALLFAAAIALASYLRAPESNSTVVPAFANENRDSSLDGLSRVIADWITDGLAHTQVVPVVDYRALAEGTGYDSSSIPSLTRARALGVGTVIRGALYRHGDTITARARIVRVSDGAVLSEVESAAPADNVRQLLNQLSGKTLGAFAELAEFRDRRWAVAPGSLPSYSAYLEYIHAVDALTAGAIESAWRHADSASRLDSAFARARILLLDLAEFRPSASRLVDSLIRVSEAQSSDLSPYDRASLDAAVAYHRGDWLERLRATKRRVDIAPYSPEAEYAYAHALIANNDFKQASAALDRIDREKAWVSRLRLFWRWKLLAAHLGGELREALRIAEQAAERYPKDYEVCVSVSDQYAAMGLEDEVRRMIAKCLKVGGQSADTATLFSAEGLELAAHGHSAAARHLAREALELRLAHDPKSAAPALRGILGKWAEAYHAFTIRDTSNVGQHGQLGVLAARSGDAGVANEADRWLQSRPAASARITLPWRARIALALGQRDRASTFFRQAEAVGLVPAFTLHGTWELTGLEDDPVVRELFAKREATR